MKDPEVLMPIQCPECRQEWLEGFPVALVADALLSGNRLRIRSRCHGAEWHATAVEMEQIREYLRAGCIGPRNTSGKYAADVAENLVVQSASRSTTGPLRRLERPTYTRLTGASAALRVRDRAGAVDKLRARHAPHGAVTPAAKVLSAMRLWVFELVFLRRSR